MNELLEGFVFTGSASLLKMLGIKSSLFEDASIDLLFKMQIQKERYEANNTITPYASAYALQTSFVKKEPRVITVENAHLFNSQGLNVSKYELLIFNFLCEASKFAPLVLSLSQFKGAVLIQSYTIEVDGFEVSISATFVETNILSQSVVKNFSQTSQSNVSLNAVNNNGVLQAASGSYR